MKKGASDVKLRSRFWANTAIFAVGLTLVIVGSANAEIRPSMHEAIVWVTLIYLLIMMCIEFCAEWFSGQE